MESAIGVTAAEVAQPLQPVRFVSSRYSALRLVIRAPSRRYDGAGNFIEFIPGQTVEFHEGMYQTTDPEEIAFLRARVGVEFTEVVGDESAIPRAGSAVQMADVQTTRSTVVEAPNRCATCGRTFRNPQTLRMHKAVHEKAGEAAPAS